MSLKVIKRLTKEEKKLDNKINSLIDFLETKKCKKLDQKDQGLLHTQLSIMASYSNILAVRINIMEAGEE